MSWGITHAFYLPTNYPEVLNQLKTILLTGYFIGVRLRYGLLSCILFSFF